jgi:hypothetical protein
MGGESWSIVLALGLLHLWVTFVSSKMAPRDVERLTRMQEASPQITKQTSMWRAYVGFNASHCVGCILFGLIYGYLALLRLEILFESTFLLMVGGGVLFVYGYLSVWYWFREPFNCVRLATIFLCIGVCWIFVE